MATQVNPTRMELSRLKKRLGTAVRGHKLLKDKQDEMARQFMQIIRRARQLRGEVERELASVTARAARAGAEMGQETLYEALMVPVPAPDVQAGVRNIMSVDVPALHFDPPQKAASLPYGFAFTPGALDGAVLAFVDLFPKMLEMAQLEKSCHLLADEIERTRRRVNALEHVMIPEMQESIRFITMKLEDNERANITRLMKVKEMLQETRR